MQRLSESERDLEDNPGIPDTPDDDSDYEGAFYLIWGED